MNFTLIPHQINNYQDIDLFYQISRLFLNTVMDKLAPGNFGLCGGANICTTCHVYVDEEYFPKLKAPTEDEIETMETNDIDQTEFSRLSCQIELHEEIKDITVTMEQSKRRVF